MLGFTVSATSKTSKLSAEFTKRLSIIKEKEILGWNGPLMNHLSLHTLGRAVIYLRCHLNYIRQKGAMSSDHYADFGIVGRLRVSWLVDRLSCVTASCQAIYNCTTS